jgi:AraC family transcriptional regulator
MASEILIKGMVCERCVAVIKGGINNLGYEVSKVSLGKVLFNTNVSKEDYDQISNFLNENGFELISNRQLRIVNQVKELVNEVFGETMKADAKMKFSSLLSERLHMNYDSISQLFTKLEGITLEKFIITQRLEKVKELLGYTDLTLTEIAYITGFSSINHLSRQFKELTGLSPSHFKSIRSVKKKLSAKG